MTRTPFPLALSAVAGAITVVLLVTGCSKGPQAGPMGGMPPPQVNVVTVQAQPVPVSFEYVGQTVGSKEVEIRARVSGIIEKRLYTEGEAVRAGQVLFLLDPKPLEAQAAASEADVATADAKLAQAAREAARLKPLVAERAVSQKDYDDAVSAEQIAAASLKAAKARLQQIHLDLGYTKVIAPVSGISGRALKSEGSLATAGSDSLLTTLVQVNPIYVSFSRSEEEQARIDQQLASGQLVLPKGAAFQILLQREDGVVLAQGGRINFTAQQVSNQTGTVENRAELPNANGKLRVGQFVRVLLQGASRPNALAIPQRAVVEGPQGKMVMVVGKGKDGNPAVEPRPVELGEWVTLPEAAAGAPTSDTRAWIVRSGLKPGDQVIVDNLAKLRPGAPVSVIAPGAASAPVANATTAAAPAAAKQ